jgi:trehalose 6-phosphate phosphatase
MAEAGLDARAAETGADIEATNALVPPLAAPPFLDAMRHALFLDFDGTLVDFAPGPDAIALRPGTLEMLRGLRQRLHGAMALVSGRRIGNIDSYLPPEQFPASGVHGQEFRHAPGEINIIPPLNELDVARQRLATMMGPADPLLLEDKGGALVLHYRTHLDQKNRAGALADYAAHGLTGLHVVHGRKIYEILEHGVTKARAVKLFMEREPFAGRMPVFVGDDKTDEDGIRAAAEAGGFGIKVGPGPTAAAYRLADVSAVHQWLRDFVNGTGTVAG